MRSVEGECKRRLDEEGEVLGNGEEKKNPTTQRWWEDAEVGLINHLPWGEAKG